ncbi:uncharacterized protein EI97DRAFT_457472 [Westerdykella ornata]|uniref:Uncharacterized protein n=1 Tax=Westerdykella ornata TaxID=318751 RepID=A0A6A6JNG1_WESOR|nr:uncharacterized protein EI97DRAFT_457472 [Westerdykella ornata]KAF2277458.1 hypothetical protein EI97DRAFT_457472 [Westerdykella ornata]
MSSNDGATQPPHPPAASESPNSNGHGDGQQNFRNNGHGGMHSSQLNATNYLTNNAADGTTNSSDPPFVNVAVNATIHIHGNDTVYVPPPANPTLITAEMFRLLYQGGPDGQGYRVDGRYPRFNVSVDAGITVRGMRNLVNPDAPTLQAYLTARRTAAFAAHQRSSSLPNSPSQGTPPSPAPA